MNLYVALALISKFTSLWGAQSEEKSDVVDSSSFRVDARNEALCVLAVTYGELA